MSGGYNFAKAIACVLVIICINKILDYTFNNIFNIVDISLLFRAVIQIVIIGLIALVLFKRWP